MSLSVAIWQRGKGWLCVGRAERWSFAVRLCAPWLLYRFELLAPYARPRVRLRRWAFAGINIELIEAL